MSGKLTKAADAFIADISFSVPVEPQIEPSMPKRGPKRVTPG